MLTGYQFCLHMWREWYSTQVCYFMGCCLRLLEIGFFYLGWGAEGGRREVKRGGVESLLNRTLCLRPGDGLETCVSHSQCNDHTLGAVLPRYATILEEQCNRLPLCARSIGELNKGGDVWISEDITPSGNSSQKGPNRSLLVTFGAVSMMFTGK